MQYIGKLDKNKIGKYKFQKIKEEEKSNIKNSIIMKAMYEQGFKDGANLIMDCKNSH